MRLRYLIHYRRAGPATRRADGHSRSLKIFANDNFAFFYATLRINRDRHTIALDMDHELPHFEIIAQCGMQQAASV